jgi:hypothetical protein
MGQRDTWDTSGGPTMPPHHMVAWPRLGRAVAWWGGPLALHLPLHPHFTLSPKISPHHSSNPCSCYSSSWFVDLLAQPIFAAEIWSICSLVCDSFDCPSRVLFSGVFLEYFSTIGDRLNEFACLFYCLEMLFWCMLTLLQLPIVVPYICLFQNHFLWGLLKIFRDGGECIPTLSTWTRGAWGHESSPWRGSLSLNLSMLRVHECCWDPAGLPNSNL